MIIKTLYYIIILKEAPHSNQSVKIKSCALHPDALGKRAHIYQMPQVHSFDAAPDRMTGGENETAAWSGEKEVKSRCCSSQIRPILTFAQQ